jgi:hypothetical protein
MFIVNGEFLACKKQLILISPNHLNSRQNKALKISRICLMKYHTVCITTEYIPVIELYTVVDTVYRLESTFSTCVCISLLTVVDMYQNIM